MGYSTDIFTSEPSASCICAVCHDVLKSASSLNCGHTFCEECIKSVVERRNPKCPNCRANITDTGSHPNFVVRDIVNALQVQCPDSAECNWTGRVDALDTHGSTCIYKIIECDVEGCTHTCQRQHMGDHLSDTDVKLRHMELKYDKKLKDMGKKHKRMATKYERKLTETISALNQTRATCRSLAEAQNTMRTHLNTHTHVAVAGTIRQRSEGEGAQRNVRARHEAPLPQQQPQMNGGLAPPPPQMVMVQQPPPQMVMAPTQIIVTGCGIDAINGVFSINGESGNVPNYVRRAQYNGREMEFRLFRAVVSGRMKWFISIFQLNSPVAESDYYITDNDSAFPPRNGWTILRAPVPGVPFIQYPNTT